MPDSGYDYQPARHRRLRRVAQHATRHAGRVAGISVAIAALAFALLRLDDPARHSDPSKVPVPATAAAAPSPTQAGGHSIAASPDAAGRGGDAAELDTAAAGAEDAVRMFLAGWLTRDDAGRRSRLLKASATRALVAGLSRTGPEQIPAGPAESVRLVGASATSAEFTAALPAVSVRIIVVADPEAPLGWRVVSIEQAGG